MKISALAFIIAILVSAPAIALQPTEIIGHIQNMEGVASIRRGDTTLPGVAGEALYRGDLILTGKPGAVGIVLSDDTTVSLGSSSELSLSNYVFDPKEGKFSLVMRMIKGTFSYITGQIVKLAPDTAHVDTPDAALAVRGTKLLIQIKE